MYAIVQAGGRQVKVSHGQRVRIDRIQADVGATHVFEKVLLVGGGEDIHVGRPYLEGVSLQGAVLGHGLADKVIIFKKRRRKNYRRKRGFRAQFTVVEIGLLTGLEVEWQGTPAEAAPLA